MRILQEGQTVRDTYTVERYLGEGAFAEVYRVQHRFLGRQAIKVFKTKGVSIEEIEAMLGEAILLSRIGHPNIIRVFDANTVDIDGSTYGFFTMEYVPGGTLDRYWQSYQNRIMPIEDAVAIIKTNEKEQLGVYIKDKSLARLQKNIFDEIWKNSSSNY